MPMVRIDRSKLNANKSPHPSFVLRATDVPYLEKLTPDQLKAIKLLHHEKMNYEEIARDTGWPPGTVRSRIHRGRAIIRQARLDAAVAQAILAASNRG